jgi:hypothetical protein
MASEISRNWLEEIMSTGLSVKEQNRRAIALVVDDEEVVDH